MSTRRQITHWEEVRSFVLAGSATFTLVSQRSGKRFTYHVTLMKPGNDGFPWWSVEIMNGPSNTDDYRFFGQLVRVGKTDVNFDDLPHTVPTGDVGALAFVWFWVRLDKHLRRGASPPPHVEFWHEGRCGRCNRKLTVPESISSGIGPVCATKPWGA